MMNKEVDNQPIITGDEITDFSTYLEKYEFQPVLTEKLDQLHTDFNQEILNEIVLWKVNRYALFSDDVVKHLNDIRNSDTSFDGEKVRKILKSILNIKGVDIAMASTILRFKNPTIFQIIDQRVYRILYGHEMPKTTVNSKKIEMYIQYLNDLRDFCNKRGLEYSDADRILFEADKDVNKDKKIRY